MRVVPRASALPSLPVVLTGRDLAPIVPALGLVGLAGAVALYALRGRVRATAGAVLLLAGLALLAVAVRVALDPSQAATGPAADRVGREAVGAAATDASAWPWAAAIGGLLLAGGGGLAVARGRMWPGLSSRYERASRPVPGAGGPAGGEGASPAALWDALDRGDDPTR